MAYSESCTSRGIVEVLGFRETQGARRCESLLIRIRTDSVTDIIGWSWNRTTVYFEVIRSLHIVPRGIRIISILVIMQANPLPTIMQVDPLPTMLS